MNYEFLDKCIVVNSGLWNWGDCKLVIVDENLEIVNTVPKEVYLHRAKELGFVNGYLVSETPESKPKAESVSDWYDYDNQKALRLPPVGERVSVLIHWSEQWSGKVTVIGQDGDGVIWRNGSDNRSYVYSERSEIRPLDWDRNAEKDALIKAVTDILYDRSNATRGELIDGAKVLYDAGYLVMPKDTK